MYGEGVTQEMVDGLVKDLWKTYSDIAEEDHRLIVSTTLDNYFSEEGILRFYETCAEKLKIPVVMDYIRADPHYFFHIESHFREESDMFRMLEDTPIEKLRKMDRYDPNVTMRDRFAALEEFVDGIRDGSS